LKQERLPRRSLCELLAMTASIIQFCHWEVVIATEVSLPTAKKRAYTTTQHPYSTKASLTSPSLNGWYQCRILRRYLDMQYVVFTHHVRPEGQHAKAQCSSSLICPEIMYRSNKAITLTPNERLVRIKTPLVRRQRMMAVGSCYYKELSTMCG